MKLKFAGAPEITASRQTVWQKLLDADFVAASAPGVESVETVDPTHFKVVSALGVGAVKVRFKLDVELYDIVDGRAAQDARQRQGPRLRRGRRLQPAARGGGRGEARGSTGPRPAT